MLRGLNFRGAFTTDTYYGINDVVQYGGQEYRTTSPFQVAADLTMQGISTSAHDPTVLVRMLSILPHQTLLTSNSFTNEGRYDASVRYERGDIVEYIGASYVAIGTNPLGAQPNDS